MCVGVCRQKPEVGVRPTEYLSKAGAPVAARLPASSGGPLCTSAVPGSQMHRSIPSFMWVLWLQLRSAACAAGILQREPPSAPLTTVSPFSPPLRSSRHLMVGVTRCHPVSIHSGSVPGPHY